MRLGVRSAPLVPLMNRAPFLAAHCNRFVTPHIAIDTLPISTQSLKMVLALSLTAELNGYASTIYCLPTGTFAEFSSTA